LIAYADTSFLFSLYVPDANSPAAAAKMRSRGTTLLVTDFGEFEFTNAVSWRVFRRQLLAGERRAALDSFSKDVEAGILRLGSVPGAAYFRAKQIALVQTPLLGARALDVLHVACAIVLKAEAFFTFDRRQAELAEAVGLRVR
jgi:predicted nucleic acid-binding protein